MKLRAGILVGFLLGILALSGTAQADHPGDTIYVDDDNCPGPGTGILADPFCTIQAAIDHASDGETIMVAAGTYNESPVIADIDGLSVIGAGATEVMVTGGVVIGGADWSGLVLQGLFLSGDASDPPGQKNAVIDSRPTTGPVSDITIRDSVLDGGNVAGRMAFYGNFITGVWTWEGNEIKNFVHWYLIDNTSSTHDVPYALDRVVFVDNWVHDVAGTVAFRGKIGAPTASATIAGNTFENYVTGAGAMAWAAIEVNNTTLVEAYDNTFSGVPEAVWGADGQALQIWSVTPWSVDIHDNDLVGNNEGIYIVGDGSFLTSPIPGLPAPTGAVYLNSFVGNVEFGLLIEPEAVGGPVNAECNWWGDADGPTHPSNPAGIGDIVSDNVDFLPFEESEDGGCPGMLEVRKYVSFRDPGRFDLLIDGTPYAEGVGFGGTTGEVEVAAGEHTVSETGVNGTDLGNYNATIYCRDEGGDGGIVAYGNGELTVDVGAGEDVVCTIVNTRVRGSRRWR